MPTSVLVHGRAKRKRQRVDLSQLSTILQSGGFGALWHVTPMGSITIKELTTDRRESDDQHGDGQPGQHHVDSQSQVKDMAIVDHPYADGVACTQICSGYWYGTQQKGCKQMGRCSSRRGLLMVFAGYAGTPYNQSSRLGSLINVYNKGIPCRSQEEFKAKGEEKEGKTGTERNQVLGIMDGTQ